jgi:DNA repair protein RecN (Recombination protein N)
MGGVANVLESVRIRNLGVIVDAQLNMGAGLTVLTGETGAGKTMVLTALNALLGAKAESALVRDGSTSADVEAIWVLPNGDHADVRDRLVELGADLDDDGASSAVVVSRSIAAQGRSRATLGGRSVASATLRDVIEPLVAVHGQADQWRLLRADEQRAMLDTFAGIDLGPYRTAYRTWRQAEQALLVFDDDVQRQGAEIDVMRAGLAQIDAVQPVEGELESLQRLAGVLGNAVMIAEAAEEIRLGLAGDGDEHADAALTRALRAADRIEAVDPQIGSVRDLLMQAQVLVREGVTALGSYMADVEADPTRLQEIEERRREIGGLLRNFGPTLADVLQWRVEAADRLAHLADPEAHRAALIAERDAAQQDALDLAKQITAARTAAATRLSVSVTEELQSLAMAGSALDVQLVPLGDEGLGEFGAEAVLFGLRTHQGGAARPLAKGASGGELARVMLALEVVLAGSAVVPTFIFDEVDAGVGGRAAIEVGRRLAALAQRAQVLVVTHLPQVAAFADTHIVVRKDSGGSVVSSDIAIVDGEDRVTELVRMLSGLPESDAGAVHAKELLQLAERARR